MIACLFHQPAFRRHLDDGEQLSPRAKAHLSACPKCREMLAAHHTIIGHLSARRNKPRETPPFLHARIMNNLETPPRLSIFRWIAVAASLAVIAAAAYLMIPTPPTRQAATWPEIPTKIAFKSSLPQNPLEQEIQNLRADTMNAAKALAATFLPESESSK
jgi:hypothetical protein